MDYPGVGDIVDKHSYPGPAMPEPEALSIMAEGRGSHFDPRIYGLFVQVLPELKRLRQPDGRGVMAPGQGVPVGD